MADITINRDKCDNCGDCTDVCPMEVLILEDGKLTLHLADPSLGDVDGDGYVNISDVTTLVNIILGK